MNIPALLQHVDRFQQKHPVLSHPYAVIKKYGDDNGGYQAALITYYGFLSLFPLLLVLVTLLHLWFRGNPQLQQDVSNSVGHYFPLLGDQLQDRIHTMRSAGVGLAIGILFTLYGARGVADALRFALDNMWQVPKSERAGFPKNMLQSLAIMASGALGFAATVAVSAFSSALGHAMWVKILLNIVGFALVSGVIGMVFRIATSGRVPFKHMMIGASIAALAIQLLLTFGGIILSHQLKNLDSVYGTFAVVLGLLFWIYLLAQILVYAAEADTVRHLKLWPRSLTGGKLQTDADRHAYRLYAKTEKYLHDEAVAVGFNGRRKR
jgi:YihY family inner membrane protein